MNNLSSSTEYFDPYQGFIDTNKELNLRFGLRLGETNLLLRPSDNCEILKIQKIYPVPNTPNWVIGLINYRGLLIPVIDLHAHLSITQTTTTQKKVLISIGHGSDAFAIFVDGLPVTIDSNIDELQKTSNSSEKTPAFFQENTLNIYQQGNRTWHEIDYQSLITSLFDRASYK